MPDKSPASANPIASLPTIAPKRPPFQGLTRGLIFLGTTAASAALGLGAALMLPLPAQLAPRDQGPRSFSDLLANGFQYQVSRPVNVLILGIDRVPTAKPGTPEIFGGRSDTMLLLRVDPSDDSVRLLSIPRDTQVEIPNVGVTKINDANVRGGPILASKTVSGVLNGIVVDRYVRVSTDAFRELVDLLGGVDVYVPERMVYEDKTQKLKINLSPGQQTLNGNEAEQFARFRQDSYGDIGRVQRQQALLKALRQRLTNPTVIPRVPALIGAMQKYIDTNLSPEEILALVRAGRKISQGDLKMVMLPGRFSAPGEFAASYWIMDPAGRDRVMQQFFDLNSSGKSDSARTATSLRVAIQNASSQPDAAAQMRSHLAKLGFYNVYVASDWSDQQRQTQIVVQQGDLKSAEELKRLLGFGNIEADSTGDLESDLTIRVGEDWARQLKP
nr:LCP family protein [Leptolyngbya sp. FACHB-36]